MVTTPEFDVPLCLRLAHDEVLLALFAETDDDEVTHRERADTYVRTAVRTMRQHPQRSYDWSGLDPLM